MKKETIMMAPGTKAGKICSQKDQRNKQTLLSLQMISLIQMRINSSMRASHQTTIIAPCLLMLLQIYPKWKDFPLVKAIRNSYREVSMMCL